jgi:TusA-related sulfurtransferase
MTGAGVPRTCYHAAVAGIHPSSATDRMQERYLLDLRGVRCPLSWAKAKIRLESLRCGDELTLLLDDPKGARDIPRAAEAEGYSAGEALAENGIYRLTIVV